MKRLVLLAILLSVVPLAAAADDSFTGRFGAGVNWEGLQAKYGFADDWLGEAKLQFASNNTLVGARAYHLFPELPRMLLVVKPYVGAELDWVFSEYLKGGVLTGGFGGFEFLPTPNIGLEIDVGLYYQNLWSSLGSVADVGVILNIGATLFF